MYGYGALSYAARHRRTFLAAASFSRALEIGLEEAWGLRNEDAARWRAHLPISLAARRRSLALLEMRMGNGEPGPLDKRNRWQAANPTPRRNPVTRPQLDK